MQLPDLNLEDEPGRIKVAITTLAFNNRDMILLLKDRGDAIEDMNWEKVENLEQKMIDLKNKQNHANLKRLTTPVHIFLTFQNEEGAERIKRYNEFCESREELSEIRLFLGKRLEFI